MFHEFRPEVRRQYLIIGAAALLATMATVWRSPKHLRLWYLLLLVGLAVSSFGAYVLENYRSLCIKMPGVSGCVWSFYYEETLEFLGVWLTLVAMLGLFSAAIPHPNRVIRLILFFFPLLTVLSLMAPYLMNYIAYRHLSEPVEVRYEADVRMQAYRLEERTNSLEIQIFMSAKSWYDFSKLGYSVHLVDQVTGDSLASTDKMASRRHGWRIALYDTTIRYSQWLSVDTSFIPANRALWAILTLWRDRGDEFVRQKVLSGDMPLLSDSQLILGELVLPADTPAAPFSEPYALFDLRFELGAVTMPERAKAGEALHIAFAWSADEKGEVDYIQFLHIGRSQSGDWWVYDQRPLRGQLPNPTVVCRHVG